MKYMQPVTLAAWSLAVAALLTGCGTTSGYKQADKTGAGIAEFRDEIVNGKKAIDNTMKSLGDIAASANTDPRKAFERYSKDVANLESTAAKIRKRGQDMKEQGQVSNDLTIGGVDAAKSLFSKTTNEGLEVQKSMDGLISELNTIAATLTPAKAVAKR